MKTIKDILLEGNKHINREVTPDNFNEYDFTKLNQERYNIFSVVYELVFVNNK